MLDITTRLLHNVDAFIELYSPHVNWLYKPSPEKWSAIEIIGHLTDSAVVNLHRFVRCTYDDNFSLTYMQKEWVMAQHYQNADINELLDLWKLLNHRIANVLRNFPPQKLHTRCNKQTVEFLAEDYLTHLRHHLDQIIALKGSN